MGGRLDGRVALVTGAARGIGKAIALTFAREGADVVINYLQNHTAANEVVETIRCAGRQAVSFQADVANQSDVLAMVEKIEKKFSKIDILINNAGKWAPGTTLDMKSDLLDNLFAVNLSGAINCVQAVVPLMTKQGYGKIVNIASVGGLAMATPNNTPYALTKAALISLTKRLALELGSFGINVNAVCPGLILTDMMSSEDAAKTTQGIIQKTILSRAGNPEDVANSALFLSSEESSFVTAQIIVVDGGRMDFLSHPG